MERSFKQDKLTVRILESRDAMGKAAAEDIARCMLRLLEEKAELNMIFAAAPSQNEVLKYLAADLRLPWERVNAFHMDEYIGLRPDAPQGFANFLRRAIFDRVPFKSVNVINGAAAPEEESRRYARLLAQYPADIVCLGIGENGHIAFNDPPAVFDDPVWVKAVALDAVCRMQQVHDGCFAALDDVPRSALTLTVPALARARYHFCVVPAASKAWAVERTVRGEIGPSCPATVLRMLDNAVLYCDADSGRGLLS